MKLQDVDFKKTYGDVPESFQHRVEYALHRTEEEETRKRWTLRTVVLVVVLMALATTAVAATISKTVEHFSNYGELMNKGTVIPNSQSIQLGDAIFTLGDVVYTNINTKERDFRLDNDSSFFFATGSIEPVAEADVIFMPDCTVDDLSIVTASDGSRLTYAQLAESTGADLVWVRAVVDGVLDENGELYPSNVGYEMLPQEDGSIFLGFEIPSVEYGVPQADSYTLQIYIAAQRMAPDGETKDELEWKNWIVEVKVPEASDAQ